MHREIKSTELGHESPLNGELFAQQNCYDTVAYDRYSAAAVFELSAYRHANMDQPIAHTLV